MNVFSSPWVPAVALLLLACGARVLVKSWLAPSAFVGLLTSIFVWVSMLATNYPIYYSGVWAIVLFVLALQLGLFIGETLCGGRATDTAGPGIGDSNSRLLSLTALRYCVVFALTAFVGTVYFVFWSFWRFDLPTSPISFLELGHLWSVQRFEYGELEPWPVRLAIMWVFPAALLGGIGSAAAKDHRNLKYSLLPFVPAVLVGSVVAARAGIVISAICWLSGYFGTKYWQSNGTYPLFRRRQFFGLAALSGAAVSIFLLIDAIRQFESGRLFVITLDPQRLLKYAFGFLPAFSSWFHGYVPSSSPALGAYTFAGIFDLLGLQHREIGLYEGHVTLLGGEETNIYTVLRGLIQDFTLGGAVFVVFVVGLAAGMCLSRPSHKNWAPILLGAGCYAFILWSPVVSVFNYNGPVLAWLVATVILRSHFNRGAVTF